MYIRPRGSAYYFRFNVPQRYRHIFGWSITRSLGSDPIVCAAVARTLGNTLRKIMKKSLDDATIKRLVDTYVKDTLESLDHYIMMWSSKNGHFS